MKIAFLVASTSRGVPEGENYITSRLLPSLLPSLTYNNEYSFYFGFDRRDEISEKNIPEISKFLNGINATYNFIDNMHRSPCLIWNKLYELAYHDNLEYFFQIGDDIIFPDLKWEWVLKFYLDNNNGYGVTGPLDLAYRVAITQAFVSRKHFETFGYLYPPVFKNYHSDVWLHNIYDYKGLATIFNPMIIKNTGGFPRYKKDRNAIRILDEEVKKGIKILDKIL